MGRGLKSAIPDRGLKKRGGPIVRGGAVAEYAAED